MIRIILKIERQDDETRPPKVAAQIALECTTAADLHRAALITKTAIEAQAATEGQEGPEVLRRG